MFLDSIGPPTKQDYMEAYENAQELMVYYMERGDQRNFEYWSFEAQFLLEEAKTLAD